MWMNRACSVRVYPLQESRGNERATCSCWLKGAASHLRGATCKELSPEVPPVRFDRPGRIQERNQ